MQSNENSQLVESIPPIISPINNKINTPLMEFHEWSVEKLSDDIFVHIDKNHRFGTDAFLLADFANPRKKDTVCDFGTGCGIIPLVMCKRFSPKSITGIDVQNDAIELFKRSVEASTVNTVLIPLLSDIKELDRTALTAESEFDIVTCNPPYKTGGSGILSESSSDKIARHETMCTIDDVCKSASGLLKFGGKLCICQRPERLLDVLATMRENGIEPKRLRFVAKDENGAPWLFLVEGKKGSKPFLQVEKTFFMYDNGEFSAELKRVYG